MSKMTFDTVSLSSEDDLALHVVGASGQKHPLSFGLQTPSLQSCDFCEVVALNRYNALVHNAKHIIIPLIKLKVHQCPICLYYFTSMYKLKHHTRNKHKNGVKTNETIDIKSKNTETIDVKRKTDNAKDILVTKDTKDKSQGLKGNESDDDDLPLIVHEESKLKTEDHVIEETDSNAVNFDNDILEKAKEKLLKDVKVVLDKIELDKLDKIVNHKLKEETVKNELKTQTDHNINIADKIKPKLTNNIGKTLAKTEPETKSITNTVVEINSHNVKANKVELNSKPATPKVKISSRLTFEDEDDEIMKDLTKDCIVDLNLFDQPWLDQIDQLAKTIDNDDLNSDVDVVTVEDSDDESSTEAKQDLINISPPAKEPLKDEVYLPSTHHEELVKPGVYRCKRCPQMFPNRFSAIQHEMQHIRIRKPRPFLCEHCDRFIATKKEIQEHTMAQHRMVYRQRPFKNCPKCGLKYNNLHKHEDIYHVTLRCHLCNKGFDTDVERLNHIRGHLIKIKCGQCDFVATEIEIQEHQRFFHKVSVCVAKTFNLCELCCLFLKNKNNMQYVFGETVSKLGTRLVCEHCGNKFFHLTQVKRFGKFRKEERITFEKEKEKRKVCSNTERLKNIQHRLKMINKLSRF